MEKAGVRVGQGQNQIMLVDESSVGQEIEAFILKGVGKE